jgi:methionyl-tRNA formyltransferase
MAERPLKILLTGQAAFGADTFRRLNEDGHEVVAVFSPGVSRSGRPDRLKAAADDAGVVAFDYDRLNDPEVHQILKDLEPDLGVMAFVTPRIPGEVLDVPKHGTIEYHPSLLPKHRGQSSINWAIINGDKFTGITIFWVDGAKGLDRGDIFSQHAVAIDPNITTTDLYNSHLYPKGLDAISQAARLISRGVIERRQQDELQATEEPTFTDRHARVNWRDMTAKQIHDLIRGADNIGAWTRLGDRKLRLYGSRVVRYQICDKPGTILGVSDSGLFVSAVGGTVKIQRLKVDGESTPVDARKFTAENGLRAGDRFLNPSKKQE